MTPASPDVSPGSPALAPRRRADRARTSRGALEGERKQVTVLFADLKGSMELLADRDPEEARALLDAVLERMMEAVHRFEGTVNQVMGDGIMALFGAPIALEDHAVRAAFAALRMQELIRSFAPTLPAAQQNAVRVRVGLNSGEVLAGRVGSDLRMDYTAVGQTTHLAARMEQMAPPGGILITAETARLVEGYAQCRGLGPRAVKGLEAPVEVFELVGVGPARSRLQVAAGRGLTHFVGRAAEVARIEERSRRAAAGHGQVVAAIGDAGVGKSRLLWEFLHSTRTAGWRLLESRSISYGRATSYLPVIGLLRTYFNVQDRDHARAIRDRVADRLAALDASLQSLMTPLLVLLDVPVVDAPWSLLEPSQRRLRTIEAVRQLLLAESRRQPLILVFEDLHWIDSETQAVLDNVVESLADLPILLLVNYRPDYAHGWAGKPHYDEIRLDTLAPDNAVELVRSLLGTERGLAPVEAFLVDRTQGNPFFLEESVRTLVETGALVGERGAYRLARSMGSVQIPVSVTALLAARIDRLPPVDKRLLESAAVIGMTVPYRLLAAIAELDEAALAQALRRLQEAEFLYETSLFPDWEHTFKHALTHDVAYEGLLRERRRALHGAIVEAMERLYEDRLDEHVERLAHHALRSERWPLAVTYLRQAGRKAAGRSAHREAVERFDQALEALEHLPESAETLGEAFDIRLELRNELVPVGEFLRIFECTQQAEALAERLGDPRRRGRIAALLCVIHFALADHPRSLSYGERALEIGRASGDEMILALANTYLGATHYSLGNYARAIAATRSVADILRGERAFETLGVSIRPAVYARGFLAWALAETGRFEEAAAASHEAVAMAETIGHPQTLAVALLGLGTIHVKQGDIDLAVPPFARARDTCQRHNLPLWSPILSSFLGYSLALAGRLDEAAALLNEARAEAAAMHLEAFRSQMTLWLAEARLLAGAAEEAAGLADEALRRARERGEAGYEAWALCIGAELAAQREPDAGRAEDLYRQVLAAASQRGLRPLVARALFGLGRLHRRQGRAPEAREELVRADGLFREMGMRLWPDRTAAELQALG